MCEPQKLLRKKDKQDVEGELEHFVFRSLQLRILSSFSSNIVYLGYIFFSNVDIASLL
jgi:hypothetical protein